MSRIVTATIGPIRATDLKLKSLLTEDHRKVDQQHPITKAMMEQLPRQSLDDLLVLRAYLRGRDSKAAGSMSTQEDIDSWIWMVEEEIKHRQKAAGSLLSQLLAALQAPEVKKT